MGCAFGCGALLLIVVAVGGVGAFLVGRSVKGVVSAFETQEQLVDRFGAPTDYVPPADGAIPADRMEIFLVVREALRPTRTELETRFDAFSGGDLTETEGGFMAVLGMLRGLGSLLDPIGEYIADRNRLLLEREMGSGEYVYIYSTSYYSWLGHSPEEGPTIKTAAAAGQPVFSAGKSTFGADQLRERYRRYAREMLKSQLEAVRKNADSDPGWIDTLKNEIGRFRADPSHVVWLDGVPSAIEASLATYRPRLEATYSDAVNCLELPTEQGQQFSITID